MQQTCRPLLGHICLTGSSAIIRALVLGSVLATAGPILQSQLTLHFPLSRDTQVIASVQAHE